MAFKRSAVRSRLSPPGRLAQLVAHPLDVREVTSSSLVSSTKESTLKSVDSFFLSTKNSSFIVKKLSTLLNSPHIVPILSFWNAHFMQKQAVFLSKSYNNTSRAV